MKNLLHTLLALLVVLLIGTGVWRLSAWAQLRRFERNDPVTDARRALASGDHRLLAGMYGGQRWIPGEAARAKSRTKLVVRMGANITDPRARRLWEASHRYIERYDSVIVAH